MLEYKVKVFEDRTEWFLNGLLHREDGAAREWADGSKEWYKNGKCHRLDGPACEYANGNTFWYKNGLCHREDGPAIEYSNGNKFWYLEGVKFTEKEFLQKQKPCTGKKVTIDGVDYELV